MKRNSIIYLFIILLGTGCGISKKVKNLTDTANQLLENINSIVLQIDSKVESGDLSEDIGNLIDGRMNNLSMQIESMLEDAGGVLFDEVNGTIDNTFLNISVLLDQIKADILDGSIPSLIDQISYQVQNNINTLSASVEDLVVLTFGNTFILVDKTVNAVVMILAIVFLAIGLIVFIIMLFRKNKKVNFFRIAAFVFMLIYIVFFLVILVLPRWRGELIAGFNFAQKYEGVKLKPRITGVYPETFTTGKNDKIFLYGKHLDKLDSLKILLRQGTDIRFTFPGNTIIAKTQNKIIIGNLSGQIWKLPKFIDFQRKLSVQDRALFQGEKYMQYATKVERKAYKLIPSISTGTITHSLPATTTLHVTAVSTPSTIMTGKYIEVTDKRKDISRAIFNPATSVKITNLINSFYLTSFKLPEGDFAIEALQNDEGVESEQFISILYPPPPAPKPDIFVTNMTFTNQSYAVINQDVTLDVHLGFSHPEEITRAFKIKVSATPAISPITINVPMGTIVSAVQNNKAVVTSRKFKLHQQGVYSFKSTVDPNNFIGEENESNNVYQKNLVVKNYYYDVNIQYLTFVSLKNMDDWPYAEDEYRISISTVVTNKNTWSFKYNKNGEPNREYSINKSKLFTYLHGGDQILFSTTGYEADDGSKDGDDSMGQTSMTRKISDMANSFPPGTNKKEYSLLLKTSHYKIIGKYTIERKIE